MRLTAIELENFKGIGNRCQRIELAPITLLFGPNSAGKSTVLHALHYAREIIERRNINAGTTLAGGNLNLGGFRNIVHARDLTRPIRIRLEAQLPHADADDAFRLNRLGFDPFTQGSIISTFGRSSLQYLAYFAGEFVSGGPTVSLIDIQSTSIELEVRWDERRQEPYVSRYVVEMNGEPFCELTAQEFSTTARLQAFNFEHPLLREVEVSDDGERASLSENPSPLTDLIRRYSRLAVTEGKDRELPDSALSVNVGGTFGALPTAQDELHFDLTDPIDSPDARDMHEAVDPNEEADKRMLEQLLPEILCAPLETFRRLLFTSTYIGPLRDVPPRGFQPQLVTDDARWANGLAAWDAILSAGQRESRLLDNLNSWLSEQDRLDSGYSFEVKEYRRIDKDSDLARLAARASIEESSDEFLTELNRLDWISDVVLRDERTGIDVLPCEIGVGLSQLVPIVALPFKRTGLFSIEQPELHVHPRIQVRLGDLFISTMTPAHDDQPICNTWLVETHSEHILLRLKRRLRETSEGEQPDWVPALRPDDIAIYFVEMDEDGSRFSKIGVDEEGEFTDVWPKGFFGERREELI